MNHHVQRIVLLACSLLGLSSCGAQPAPATALPVGVTWEWVGLSGAQPAVANSQDYLLLLNQDGTYAFKADCNKGIGEYSASGTSLTIHPAPVVLADCGPESASAKYLSLLGDVTGTATEGDQFVLTLKGDAGRMTFARSAATLGAGGSHQMQIVGVTWQWIDMIGPRPAGEQLMPDPGKYTLILNQDGTYKAVADCNTSTGTFTIEGDRLTLTPEPATLAACGPGSLSQQYLTLLGSTTSYEANAGRLTLSFKVEPSSMVFARM